MVSPTAVPVLYPTPPPSAADSRSHHKMNVFVLVVKFILFFKYPSSAPSSLAFWPKIFENLCMGQDVGLVGPHKLGFHFGNGHQRFMYSKVYLILGRSTAHLNFKFSFFKYLPKKFQFKYYL